MVNFFTRESDLKTAAYPFTDVVLQQLPEAKKLDLLKNLAESSPYTSAQDARQLLPSIILLLKVIMPVLCSALQIMIL
jgi:hypothetical protein